MAVRPDQGRALRGRPSPYAPLPWPSPLASFQVGIVAEVWTLDPLAVLEVRWPDLLGGSGDKAPPHPPKLETSCFLLSGLKFPLFFYA